MLIMQNGAKIWQFLKQYWNILYCLGCNVYNTWYSYLLYTRNFCNTLSVSVGVWSPWLYSGGWTPPPPPKVYLIVSLYPHRYSQPLWCALTVRKSYSLKSRSKELLYRKKILAVINLQREITKSGKRFFVPEIFFQITIQFSFYSCWLFSSFH